MADGNIAIPNPHIAAVQTGLCEVMERELGQLGVHVLWVASFDEIPALLKRLRAAFPPTPDPLVRCASSGMRH